MALNKNSTGYMYGFALLITLVCGVLLAMVSEATKEAREANVKVEKMSNILSTVNYTFEKGVTNAEVEEAYKSLITEVVVNKEGEQKEGVVAFDVDLKTEQSEQRANADYDKNLAVFIFTDPETSEKFYVVPMRGNGLWGAVWGYLSLKSDFATIYGVKFDHESETPGLGAEITKDWFQTQFPSKKVYNEDDEVALSILKG
ncbi:MAG: FMN-binding protein, partial [Bacteroidia bacterium]